ncbi:MAG: hypothetical protein CMF12_11780 [Idiomarina sp.]|uniref:Uncharacterized protein DUF3530 n=1 Tax=Idiomarina aquatica TaxID=1327752 RepID=A0A4R6P515_9GAMM|nr:MULTISPECIES: DUF3530 family protein [Idiomarina]MAK71806.1 hypothetical protein [Idiomarinaceae bacterium]MBT43196.1 hypothetical protein [Idiomarina sp.]TDP32621.1 uncharacterized protein DUF3530 [Idiomarina aquatica]HAD47250.1 DUF3530 domain-containing protein [Idiomarina sp.]
MKIPLIITFVAVALVSLTGHANDDLQRYLPPDQVRWLNADAGSGNDADSNTRYLALYKEPMASFPRGQIVSLPDWHLHPLQSNLIQGVYADSPDLGWHSWALVPPVLTIERSQLATTQANSVFPEVVDEAFFEPHREALKQRVQRLTREFDNEPGFTVWVVEGITAAIAVKLISAEPELMPDALVVIDLYLPQLQLNQAVSRQLAQLQLPVLDIISNSGNRWIKNAQPLRRQYSQKYQQVNYRQRQLLSNSTLATAELRSTLKGWLKYHGF